MKAKQRLYRYGQLSAELRVVKAKMLKTDQGELERIRELWGSLMIPATASDGMPHAHSAGDRIASVLADIELLAGRAKERYRLLAVKEERLQGEMDLIEDEIEAVEDANQRLLLYLRYVVQLRWDEIAEELHVSEGYCRGVLHGTALRTFAAKNGYEE